MRGTLKTVRVARITKLARLQASPTARSARRKITFISEPKPADAQDGAWTRDRLVAMDRKFRSRVERELAKGREVLVDATLGESLCGSSGDPHYQPPPPAPGYFRGERKAPAMTDRAIRRLLGRDRKQSEALRDKIKYEATVNCILRHNSA